MTTRRHFLGAAAAAGLGMPLLSEQAVDSTAPTKKVSANDKIQIALIGCGGMGQGDAKTSTDTKLTKLVAACDCYQGRLEHMKEEYGQDIFTTKHYEEILSRPDIDAVIIGTPDHWHQKISIDAMKAKKDVYCEKPMVQHIDDGAAVVEAQRTTGRILQIGSQRVSSVIYQKAQEIYRSGQIGQLMMVEAWWDRNSAVGAWEYTVPTDADTTTCDWIRFQGRAPEVAWDPKRFFRWRCYRDYGTGVAGDLFVHLFSGLHFITGATGPTRVFATGGLRFWNDGRDVPDVLLGLFDYPKTDAHPGFNLTLRVNFVSGAQESSGFRFVGSEGILMVDSGVHLSKHPPQHDPGLSIETFSDSMQARIIAGHAKQYPKKPVTPASLGANIDTVFRAPRGYSDHYDHHLNFAKSVRSRTPVVEDAVFGFRAAGPALLSNMSYFEGRPVDWDPGAMKLIA
jgi:predicted dehydrogenase